MHGLQLSTYIGNIDKDIHHPTCFDWPNFHLTVTCKLILFMDIYTLNLLNMWLWSCYNFSLLCDNSCWSQCKWFGYLPTWAQHCYALLVTMKWWKNRIIDLVIHLNNIVCNFNSIQLEKIKLNSTILNWSQIQLKRNAMKLVHPMYWKSAHHFHHLWLWC